MSALLKLAVRFPDVKALRGRNLGCIGASGGNDVCVMDILRTTGVRTQRKNRTWRTLQSNQSTCDTHTSIAYLKISVVKAQDVYKIA